MAFYQFQKEQFIKASIEEIWDFISSPQNFKKITPKNMGFDIRTPNLLDKIFNLIGFIREIMPYILNEKSI